MKNGSGTKRPAARTNGSATTALAPEVAATPFAGIAVEAIDAPMWPIHPPGWFQPDAPAAAPSWSGLTIERHNRIPAPDFVRSPLEPFDHTAVADGRREACRSSPKPGISGSDLAPLGWDPRAICLKKEMQ
jgi:hypothetical protein